jgi:hypothetical protein
MDSDPNSPASQRLINFPYITTADWTLFRAVLSSCFVSGVASGTPPSIVFGLHSTDVLRRRLQRFGRMIMELINGNHPTGHVGFLVASLVVELASRGDFIMDMRMDSQYVLCELYFKRV